MFDPFCTNLMLMFAELLIAVVCSTAAAVAVAVLQLTFPAFAPYSHNDFQWD